MTYLEFLQTIKVLKMLFGREVAEKVFTKNINSYYNLNSENLLNCESKLCHHQEQQQKVWKRL